MHLTLFTSTCFSVTEIFWKDKDIFHSNLLWFLWPEIPHFSQMLNNPNKCLLRIYNLNDESTAACEMATVAEKKQLNKSEINKKQKKKIKKSKH